MRFPLPEDSFLSRRRFGTLLVLAPLTLFAADSARASAPAPSAGALYDQGLRLLRLGRQFDRAAEYLALAAQKVPGDPATQLALGCAYASRAASLSYAASFTKRLREARATFAETVQEWETQRDEMKAQLGQVFNAAEFEKSRPVLPPLREFPTKDDNRPYRLTAGEETHRLTELYTRARAAWEAALVLSKTPEETARAYYIRGWGMRVLHLSLSGKTDDSSSLLPSVKLPTDDEIKESFRRATVAEEENPLYRQALGDIQDNKDAAKTEYLRALDLKPRNAATLWYLLYNREASNAYEKPKTEWPVALGYLHHAQVRDAGNAWPLYEEAGILFRSAPYSLTGPSESRNATEKEKEAHRAAVRNNEDRKNGRHAIDLLVQGNGAPQYVVPVYRPSVPDVLASVWHYRYFDLESLGGMARVRELARAGAGYAQFMASEEKDSGEAVRAAGAVIGLGKRIAGRWPEKDDPETGETVIQSLVGAAIVSIGLKSLQTVYETLGDSANADAARAETEALKLRIAVYQKAVQAIISGGDFAAY